MPISQEQLDHYRERRVLVLEGFADEASCDGLRARAEELVQEFDPADIVSVFSTREQNRLTDEYFLTSGDKIRFFFEENAFLPDGKLRFEKEKSINKIGHALHDLDPVFDNFSRSQKVRDVATAIGERVLLPAVREAPEESLILADGFSCREQIERTGRRTRHIAELLAERMLDMAV